MVGERDVAKTQSRDIDADKKRTLLRITFIFLPLTFMVGFFGMNVSTFEGEDNGDSSPTLPSIKYYFIAAVVMMMLVLILWYTVKHCLAAQRYTPYQRGIYEHLFHDLAVHHPRLWTCGGPQPHIRPLGFFNRVRWRLLQKWFDPKHTTERRTPDPDEDAGGSGLGVWARMKRLLARRWLKRMNFEVEAVGDEEERMELIEPGRVARHGGAMELLVNSTAAVGAAEAIPGAVDIAAQRIHLRRLRLWHGRARIGTSSPAALPAQAAQEPEDEAGSGSESESEAEPKNEDTSPTRPSSSGSSNGPDVETRNFDEIEPEDPPWKRGWKTRASGANDVVGSGSMQSVWEW